MNNIDQKSPKLAAYLERIGFYGTARPDLETLRELQRTHVRAVPFENLDVQLHRPVGLDLDTCFDKIVRQRRGGWCFELNGLLDWALREIGFDVARTSAGVMREHLGDVQMGDHSDMGDGYWRFSERAHAEPFSFDFFIGTADETRFAEKCSVLQTSLDSPFVQNLVVQRRTGDTHLSLRGRVLTTLRKTGEEKIKLASVDEFVAALRDRFDLDVPEAATLWPAICARHDALFKDSES